MKDHFATLGLKAGASDDDVRQAYRRLAMQHHPDRGGDSAEFQAIQEAYATLSDPQRRAEWEQQQSFANMGGQPGGFNFSFNFGGPDINDILRGFHGHDPFGAFRNRAPRNRDLRAVIDLDLASTLNTQQRHIDIRNPDGASRTVKVDIPRGVQSGMQMRCPGHGETHIAGVPAGDLMVEFRVAVPSHYQVQHINVLYQAPINCIDAITGTKITVPGIDGRMFDLSVPRGSQHGTQLRLAQQGLWDVNQPVRGDLLVEILLEVPQRISTEQLTRLQQLN